MVELPPLAFLSPIYKLKTSSVPAQSLAAVMMSLLHAVAPLHAQAGLGPASPLPAERSMVLALMFRVSLLALDATSLVRIE